MFLKNPLKKILKKAYALPTELPAGLVLLNTLNAQEISIIYTAAYVNYDSKVY